MLSPVCKCWAAPVPRGGHSPVGIRGPSGGHRLTTHLGPLHLVMCGGIPLSCPPLPSRHDPPPLRCHPLPSRLTSGHSKSNSIVTAGISLSWQLPRSTDHMVGPWLTWG